MSSTLASYRCIFLKPRGKLKSWAQETCSGEHRHLARTMAWSRGPGSENIFFAGFGPKMTNFGIATNFKTRSSSVLVKQRQVQLCAWNLLKLYFLIHFLRPLALWNSSLPRRLLHSSGIPRHHPIFSSLFWGAETPSAGSSCARCRARDT